MAEPTSRVRPLFLGVGALALLAALVAARGSVALLAVALVAIVVAVVVGVVPMLRNDGIDWSWQPGRGEVVPPEHGMATLSRLLEAGPDDPRAAADLQGVVRALADEQAAAGRAPAAGGPLSTYLAGPPRRLTLDEADRVVAELEHPSPTKETP